MRVEIIKNKIGTETEKRLKQNKDKLIFNNLVKILSEEFAPKLKINDYNENLMLREFYKRLEVLGQIDIIISELKELNGAFYMNYIEVENETN
jgi:hypothetical protein